MTVYQVLLLFLNGASYTSLRGWARQFPNVSYDSLIAFFRKSFDPQILITQAWQRIRPLTQGWLIIDQIVIEKAIVGLLNIVKFNYKSDGGYVTPSISIVMLLWSNGVWRIPLGFRLWTPGAGTHTDAAMDLLSWVRNQLKWKPLCVLFDSQFAVERLLQRIDAYGWAFACQVPKSRKFEERQLWQYKRQGYWHAVGEAWCGLKLLAIRRADKFYITNRVSWDPEMVMVWYSRRAMIEEVFKILKGLCHWGTCQLQNGEAYERFLAMGVVTFIVWEATRIEHQKLITIYELRKKAILCPRMVKPPNLERLRAIA